MSLTCRILGHRFWFSYYKGGPRRPAYACTRCGKMNK